LVVLGRSERTKKEKNKKEKEEKGHAQHIAFVLRLGKFS